MEERTLVFIENVEAGIHDYFSLTESEVQFLKYLCEEGYLNAYICIQYDVELPTPIVFGAQNKRVIKTQTKEVR